MEKFKKFLFLLLILFSFSFISACNEEIPSEVPTEIITVRVKFVVDDEVYDNKKYEIGEEIKLPEEPTKEGYEFVGWYTEEDELFKGGKVKDKITLYAKFEKIDSSTPEERPTDIPSVNPTPVPPKTEGKEELPDFYCDHTDQNRKELNLKNACVKSIIYDECMDCGMKIFSSYTLALNCTLTFTSDYYMIDENGIEARYMSGHCVTCGIEFETKRFMAYNDDCKTLYVTRYSFAKDGKEVISNLYELEFSVEHGNVSTTYVSLGNCDKDGFIVQEKCYDCGNINEYKEFGHSHRYFETTISSGCGDYILWGNECEVCGKKDHINISFPCDLNYYLIETYEKENGTVSMSFANCNNCGFDYKMYNETTHIDMCDYDYSTRYVFSNHGKVDEYETSHVEIIHQFETTFENYTSCDATYEVVNTCIVCNGENRAYINGHYYTSERELYDEICGGVEVITDGCIACGEGYHTYLNEYSPWYFKENTDNYSLYLCENGCCTKEIYAEHIKLNDCETLINEHYIYKHNGITIIDENLTFNRFSHRLEVTSVNMYGNTCDDGCDFIANCSNCDYNEVHNDWYGHYAPRYDIEFTEICGTIYYIEDGCIICGKDHLEGYYESDTTWNEVIFTPEYSHYICDKGCCNKSFEYETIKNDSCQVEYRRTISYYHNDVLIVEDIYSEYRDEHFYEYTYELYGTDCEDGYVQRGRCIYCGYETEEEKNYHQSVEITKTNSIDGYCGSEYYMSICAVCDQTLSFNPYYDNCNYELIGNIDGEEVYECIYCHAIKATGLELVSSTLCEEWHKAYERVTYNGEEIYFKFHYSLTDMHDKYYEVQNYDGNCNNYYNLIKRCYNCDYYQYHENVCGHTFDSETVNISLNCGSVDIFKLKCVACGNTNYSYAQEYMNFYYASEFDNHITYKCANGCCVKSVSYYISEEDGCYKSIGYRVSYNLYAGNTIDEYTYSESKYIHDFQTTITMNELDCNQGFSSIKTCSRCGETEEEYGFGHMTEVNTVNLNNPNFCGAIFEEHCCRICEDITSHSFNEWNCDLVYVETIGAVVHEKCTICSADVYYEMYTEATDKLCYNINIYNIYIYLDDQLLYSISTRNGHETHEFTYEAREYLSCDDEYLLHKNCVICGYDEEYYTKGHVGIEMQYPLEADGYCGGNIGIYGYCVICEQIDSAYLYDCNCNFAHSYLDKEGKQHQICITCGAEFITYRTLLEKDEYCYGKFEYHLEIIYNGETLAEEVYISYDTMHNFIRNYHPNGTVCSEGGTYDYYCTDCGCEGTSNFWDHEYIDKSKPHTRLFIYE